MALNEIQKVEQEIAKLTAQLHELQKNNPRVEISNYEFNTESGKLTLLELFWR